MATANEMLLESLIQQGIISQEDFDKKVEEYSIPVKKEKLLLNSIKTAETLYEEAIESDMPVEDVRHAKINQLKYLCSMAVYAGFRSDALGHSFGFNEHDQANISQQLILFLLDPSSTAKIEWKTIGDGVILLTKNQFLQLVGGAKNHKIEKQARYWDLEEQVLLAETVEEIKAVIW